MRRPARPAVASARASSRRRSGRRRYLCLGKRALYLIDFEPPFKEMFYYAWIQRVRRRRPPPRATRHLSHPWPRALQVIVDSDNLLLFQVRAACAGQSMGVSMRRDGTRLVQGDGERRAFWSGQGEGSG